MSHHDRAELHKPKATLWSSRFVLGGFLFWGGGKEPVQVNGAAGVEPMESTQWSPHYWVGMQVGLGVLTP